jgi:hypothetical protein
VLQFLLDEHIAPSVAAQLRRRHRGLVVFSLADWGGGALLGAGDDQILAAAARAGLTLVTYDVHTVPPVLKEWAETGQVHAGVVFVDSRAIPQRDLGTLTRALGQPWEERQGQEWKNRVVFVTR